MLALMHGEQMIKQVNMALICESSQIFLNKRNLLGKFEWKGPMATLNAMCFFFCYISFRVLLFPFILYGAFAINKFIPARHWTPFNTFVFWVIVVIFVLIYLLNLFWFKLILGGLIKMIKGIGSDKKKDDEESMPLTKI